MSSVITPELAALFKPLTLTVTKLTCKVDTDEFDSDEPYIIVFTANLSNQVINIPGGGKIIIPATRTTLIGPWDDFDTGETGSPVAPPPGLPLDSPWIFVVGWPCWATDGKPAPIASPNNVIFLVALLEHDGGEPNSVRAAVQAGLSANLQGYVNDTSLSRAQMIQNLVKDMNGLIDFAAQSLDGDERIGSAKELQFTAAEMAEARSNKKSKELEFKGDGGKYTVKFVLRKA
ncbi:hypothetical protein ANRL1_00695 [Anaerolineae bacterium]|nr:hypothetical protein ANRL1_00695 [Anaerolineae bacterium]